MFKIKLRSQTNFLFEPIFDKSLNPASGLNISTTRAYKIDQTLVKEEICMFVGYITSQYCVNLFQF